MNAKVDQTPGPLYGQVKQYVMGKIAAGKWPAGMKLPSENELVSELGISRMTVHRALRELMNDGIIMRIQGVGSFVLEPPVRSELFEIRDISEDIVSRGHEHSALLIDLDAIRSDAELALSFDLRPGAKIFHSIMIHYEDELPIQLEERFVTPRFAPAYLEQDFTMATPSRYLQSIAEASEVEHVVYAIAPDVETCRLLKLDAAEPCLLLQRRTWVDGKPATKSLFTYPGSRHSLGGRYRTGTVQPAFRDMAAKAR
ncbi:MAG: histidine utilization repressor [Parvibaculaceae bacterium]|nr:histidine utilization repressor [Parvibaculaceae bacterium]